MKKKVMEIKRIELAGIIINLPQKIEIPIGNATQGMTLALLVLFKMLGCDLVELENVK